MYIYVYIYIFIENVYSIPIDKFKKSLILQFEKNLFISIFLNSIINSLHIKLFNEKLFLKQREISGKSGIAYVSLSCLIEHRFMSMFMLVQYVVWLNRKVHLNNFLCNYGYSSLCYTRTQ